MKISRTSNVNAHRDSWVEVNIDNVSNNIKELKKCIPQDKKILAVVKADFYGHGAAMLAPTMLASGGGMFGVASIYEEIGRASCRGRG